MSKEKSLPVVNNNDLVEIVNKVVSGKMESTDVDKLASYSEVIEKINNMVPKKVNTEELKSLVNLENRIRGVLQQIGQLELEKAYLMNQANSMQESKDSFLETVAIKHHIPTGTQFTVDMNTGEIKIQR